jgi:hypothetical protein
MDPSIACLENAYLAASVLGTKLFGGGERDLIIYCHLMPLFST